MVSGDRANTSPDDTDLSEPRSSPPKKGQGKKGKPGSSKKMSQKEQSERIKEAARELGVDESGKLFDDVAGRLVGGR